MVELPDLNGFLEERGIEIGAKHAIIAAVVIVALAAGAFFYLQGEKENFTIIVSDEQSGIPLDASVTIIGFSEVISSKQADANGIAVFEGIPLKQSLRAIAEKEGYYAKGIDLNRNTPEVKIKLERQATAVKEGEKPKMILLTSKKNLEEIVGIAGEHSLPIISDETYDELVFGEEEFTPIVKVADRKSVV